MSGVNKYTPANSFFGSFKDLLVDYTDEVADKVNEAVRVTADYSRKSLRSQAGKFKNRTGKYRKGWGIKMEYAGRYYAMATISNYKYYPLTHLLENGHALVRGGRRIGDVQAFPHIADVQEEADRMIIEEIERALG